MSTTIGTANELGLSPETIGQFLRAHWKRVLCLSTPSFYRWQFLEPPEAVQQDHSVAAVDADGNILAYMGVQPRPFRVGDRVVPSGEMTTWIVHTEHRSRGLGVKVLLDLQKRYPVLYGASPSREGTPLFLRTGFRITPAVPRYVRVLRPQTLAEHLPLTDSTRKLLKARNATPPPCTCSVRAIPATELPQVSHDLNGPVRSPAYLSWRYDQHPVYAYRAFRLETPHGDAGVVLRIDSTPTLKVLHVVECTGPEESRSEAVSFIEHLAQEEEVDLADISCTSDAVTFAFRAAGWFSVLEDPVELPHLFYPLEVRSPASSGLLLWTGLTAPRFWKASSLYMTKGDIDMDRPTQNYFDAHSLSL